MSLFSIPSALARPKKLLLFCLLLCTFFCSAGCKKELCYFDYVSELRNNLFLARNEDFSLRVYSVVKETPYAADGVPQETSSRVEAYLVAPSGAQTVNFHFQIDERTFGGEMSYDNVTGEYYYSCTLDASKLSSLPCQIDYGNQAIELTANSVLTETTLSPTAALDSLIAQNGELFTSLTDEYGFAGEIYLRLIYEDAPYYYAGVIDRSGKIYAFLLNAQTGKVLAARK